MDWIIGAVTTVILLRYGLGWLLFGGQSNEPGK